MSEKEPKKEFTGWFIPVHVIELFEKGIINAKELILLGIIHGLQNGKKEGSSHKGCYASNKYLGEKLHISEERVRQMISKLKKLELIVQTAFDGRSRFLRTYWDMSPEDRKKLEVRPLKNKGGRLVKNKGGRPSQKLGVDIVRDNLSRKGQSKKTVRRTGVRRSQDNNLFSGQKAKGSGQERMEALAKKIRATLRKETPTLKMVRERKTDQYVKQLRRLVKIDYSLEEIETVFSWWLKHHCDEYVRKIRSLADIYDEFSIVKQMMESAKETSPNGNGQVHKLSNGRKITADNMYESENCSYPGVPRIWADYDGKQYDGELVDRVRSRCQKLNGNSLYVPQEMLDEVLKELGEEPGCIPITVAGG